MSKYAGFLKRLKQLTLIPLKVVRGVNNVYKKVSPYIKPIIDIVPFGSLINLAMDGSSKIMDLTTKPLDKYNQQKINNKPYNGHKPITINQRPSNNSPNTVKMIY